MSFYTNDDYKRMLDLIEATIPPTYTSRTPRNHMWELTTKERRQVHYHAARPGRVWK